ncbi:MAG: DUF72 domain-containing protein [Candidatus Neomarinimicrobiota bacterium]|nr:MAG: DUF72 domain-containing protein [Candidatus Neomarinimicrobiota bacterium]RKY53579.1 MAG: DUF72 domain-containing protein [Candidatus Neomarinimicrobiota bacterium]
MTGKIFVGTSGWSYKHWIGRFYPEELKTRAWLQFYVKHFRTVEINSSFYHLVAPKTYANWYSITPDSFQFAVKASRFITHVKRLVGVDDALSKYMEGVRNLKEKLGVILFQLPPSMKYDRERIFSFIEVLYSKGILPGVRVSFEVRNRSFLVDEFFELLAGNNIALCFSDWPGVELDSPVTADFVYIRRHGPRNLYVSNYSDEELSADARFINECSKKGIDCFVYFNNDACAFAIDCCFRVLKMIQRGM